MTRLNARRTNPKKMVSNVFRLVGGKLRSDGPPVVAPERPAVPAARTPTPRPTQEDIRLAAYHKWCEAGHPPGDGQAFWLAAERELIEGSI